MAINQQEYYQETSRGALPRLQPAEGPGAVVVKTWKAGTAALRNAGTAVYLDTTDGTVDIVDFDASAGTDPGIVYGFLLHPINSLGAGGSNDVACSIMIRGEAHYADIAAAATRAQYGVSDDAAGSALIRTGLRAAALRDKGLYISGLDAIHSTLST